MAFGEISFCSTPGKDQFLETDDVAEHFGATAATGSLSVGAFKTPTAQTNKAATGNAFQKSARRLGLFSAFDKHFPKEEAGKTSSANDQGEKFENKDTFLDEN
ncbi:hypothetical protein D8B26_007726 [Coccidioides posadasii str. Silveira]|uniref:uncharacterized protein n=1 Tax=Coccidioides posadasii (strain RMSCC 757 / Silveira) TaxID=443226 RepID=UPI001BEF6B62|nr:hypothetical protein D8B26_007726 [Coccidioides posadasii str. Silveira]